MNRHNFFPGFRKRRPTGRKPSGACTRAPAPAFRHHSYSLFVRGMGSSGSSAGGGRSTYEARQGRLKGHMALGVRFRLTVSTTEVYTSGGILSPCREASRVEGSLRAREKKRLVFTLPE